MTTSPIPPTRDYTLSEVADALRMSTRWVRDRINEGKTGEGPVIEHERRGHKILFTEAQLDKLRHAFTDSPPVAAQSITTGRRKKSA